LSKSFSADRSELFKGRGWVVLLRGLTAITFGILALASPHTTPGTLGLLFGLYALAHGILSVAAAIGGRGQHGCLLLATEGIIGLWAGVVTLWTTLPSPKALIFLIWVWAVGAGVLRIVEAIRLRKEISGDVWLALSGSVTVLLAIMLMLRPVVGAVGLALLISAFAFICGVFEILLGYELRAAGRRRLIGSA